jgi:hypothetical protein
MKVAFNDQVTGMQQTIDHSFAGVSIGDDSPGVFYEK